MNRRVVAKPDVVVAQANPPKKSRTSPRAWREQHFYSLFSSLGRLAARPWATSMTLAVLSLALAFPLLFWLLLDNARGLSGTVEDSRAISVFMKSGTDAAAVEAMAAKLRQHADVQSVVVKTPEQGLEEFKAHSGFADALNVLHYNPLPALLIVDPRAASGSDADPSPALVEEFRRDPAVDQVQYDAAWKQRLNAILQLARRSAVVLAVLLALTALLVVGNTVRLDIQGRADEIAVMQLLGADNGFVRRPFLYIGFWYGMFAGVASLILIGLVEWALAAPLSALASSYDHRFDVHGLSIAQMAVVLAASAALGWLGAWIAASRHIALGQPT